MGKGIGEVVRFLSGPPAVARRACRRKAGLSRIRALLAVLMVTGAGAGAGTVAAFSSTSANSGDSITAGTVAIADNDSAAAMFSVTDMLPSDPPVEKCIKVDYTGSLDADVKTYTTTTIGAVGPYVDLKIETGSVMGTFPACGSFTADSTLFDSTLAAFDTSYNDWSDGLADYPGAGSKWVTNDAVVYRYTLSLQNNSAAEGLSTGSFSFTWEARNQ